MALTIAKGYIQDPNNPNAVIKADSTAMPGSVASFTQPTTLNSSNTTPTTAISLTQKPDNTNYQAILAGAQQQALSIQQQIAQMNPPKTETPQKDTSIQDYINSITAVQKPSATQTYQSGYDASGLAQQQSDLAGKAAITTEAQGRLNNISAQLTALNTEAQAIPIRDQQDAQGRGITTAGLATKTADELRTNALKALPLQAQAAVIQAEVATAQGNQKLAQDLYTQASDHFDKMFTLQMQDLNNKYEFQTNLIDKVYAFADKQEQRTLDALKLQAQQDFQVQQDTVAYNRQIERDKLNNQQQLNRDKINNQQDIAKINLQNQIKTEGTSASSPTGQMQLASAKNNIDLIGGLATNGALNSAVGPNAIARFSPLASVNGTKTNFISGVQQLTSQLSLDSLVRAKAQGATFGALSEGELNLLSSSATKLNNWAIKDKTTGNVTGYNANENDFKKELDKINNLAKLDYILKGGNPEDIGAVQQSNGKYLVKNSDGTYTEL